MPERKNHLDALAMVEKANANGGDVTGQIFPRPIGLVLGLDLSGNPFVMYPSYRAIADLPLALALVEPLVADREQPLRHLAAVDLALAAVRYDRLAQLRSARRRDTRHS